jgi:hypothetical protein
LEIKEFCEIEAEFTRRVHKMVWCSLATIDSRQRPRSRIMHPIWEGSTGWIGTHRQSFKSRHLARNPHVSLAYVADITHPVYADCIAEWADDPDQKHHVWDLFRSSPPPLGYDPAPIFVRPDHENFGVLKRTPWRIELVTFPEESLGSSHVWRDDGVAISDSTKEQGI